MTMWFTGKRVVLARDVQELGGGPPAEKGITGTIIELFDAREYWFHCPSRPSGVCCLLNCVVHWDDNEKCYQHTNQLEPLVPDEEGLNMTAEELLESCLPVEA